MAESGGPKNYACIVNCIGKEGGEVLYTLVEELTGQKISNKDSSVKWIVDNKYYKAEVEFFLYPSTEQWRKEREYQAIVLLCDLDKEDILEQLQNSWDVIKSPDESEVRVVMGVANSDTATTDVLKWCVCEGMELVEWERGENSQPQETDSDDGLPPETVGVDRLSETLQAHMWPNVTMKGRDPTTSKQPSGGSSSTAESVNSGETAMASGLEELESKVTSTGSKQEANKRVDDLFLTEEQLSALKNSEDPGGENFEDLFSRFAQMKEHAESLPHEERKAYAEKVAMAFWSAIDDDDNDKPSTN